MNFRRDVKTICIVCNCAIITSLSSCSDVEDAMSFEKSEHVLMQYNYDSSNLGCIKNRIGVNPMTRTAGDVAITPYIIEEDTVLFLANYPSGGWEIFSNNRSLPMSLASSEVGTLDIPNDSVNNLMDAYIISLANNVKNVPETQSYGDWKAYDSTISSEELQSLMGNLTSVSNSHNDWPIEVSHDSIVGRGGWANPVLVSEIRDTVVYVPHFLRTHWHQEFPWNNYIPLSTEGAHMSVGCGAVAVGQYLYYTHQTYGKPISMPNTGIYNNATNRYSFYNLSPTIWNKMSIHDFDFSHSCDSTAVYLGYIAEAIHTNYGPTLSGSYTNNTLNFLETLGFHLSNRCFPSYNAISIFIRQHRPLILELGITGSTGHLLVIDAIRKINVTKRYRYGWLGIDHDGNMTMEFDSTGNITSYKYISYEDIESTEEQVQMNWGWGFGYFNNYDDVWYSLLPSSVWHTDGYDFDSQNVWLLNF